ncbi:MAG: tRNA (5-methylaminomethyl-2-thiouridylate)-methyltransferase [Spirochaetia bacterium]|nr:tRNA (5-methylaminomethyl-2-thiouridylate)-methyltransferase [Spirochaetia bacterium]
MKEKTCIALYSGGLDSLLAAKVMMDLGFKVIILNFSTGFFFNAYTKDADGGLKYKAPAPDGYDIRVVDISKDFFEMIKNPAHGYGSNMNPCIDCKIMMLRKAKSMMEELGAGFVVTGEVLGQRPMSQNGHAMIEIEKEAGLQGWLLRPLCAKNLQPTEPENLGWVDREKLLDFKGRTRKPQLAMARLLGWQKYIQAPAGGCILTDESYSKKLKDLFKHKGRSELQTSNSELTSEDVLLLTLGRQFRRDGVKFIIGRDQEENKKIAEFKGKGTTFDTKGISGPTGFTLDAISDEMKTYIACAVAGFSKVAGYCEVAVVEQGEEEVIKVKPLKREELAPYRIDA